jgi:hypothetical protein
MAARPSLFLQQVALHPYQRLSGPIVIVEGSRSPSSGQADDPVQLLGRGDVLSDEGVRLIMRAALVIFLIIGAAFFKILVGPGKRRGQIMLAGTLGGFSSGVRLSYPI